MKINNNKLKMKEEEDKKMKKKECKEYKNKEHGKKNKQD